MLKSLCVFACMLAGYVFLKLNLNKIVILILILIHGFPILHVATFLLNKHFHGFNKTFIIVQCTENYNNQ